MGLHLKGISLFEKEYFQIKLITKDKNITTKAISKINLAPQKLLTRTFSRMWVMNQNNLGFFSNCRKLHLCARFWKSFNLKYFRIFGVDIVSKKSQNLLFNDFMDLDLEVFPQKLSPTSQQFGTHYLSSLILHEFKW